MNLATYGAIISSPTKRAPDLDQRTTIRMLSFN